MSNSAIRLSLAVCVFGVAFAAGPSHAESLVAEGAEMKRVSTNHVFTEGPAVDKDGNLFFTDLGKSIIHKLSLSGDLSDFNAESAGSNGLYFDSAGTLFACEQNNGRIVRYGEDGATTVLVDSYDGKPFNSPNDLWVDAKGGVYFSDPRYFRRDEKPQDGEHVYYIAPNGKTRRIIDDMVRPNGIIGTADGKTLYVADHGGNKTYAYSIAADGSLSNKREFAPEGADGITLDERGNLYLAGQGVTVYSPGGTKLETIDVPEGPSNVTFGGKDGKTLFITARTSVYAIDMRVGGQR
ncbi:MAG: SMP-30/gluconolactonase/LRE family protein [Candidatus Hydrogenedentes bacterium]|nr:SMP-30/gluconolactonase/LRE family protein [Candidatus Hydrogenedentota bacterium]